MATFLATSNDDVFLGTSDVSDTVDYSASGGPYGININIDGAWPGAGNDKFISIENIIGTEFRDVVWASSPVSHTLSLGAGDDEFLLAGPGPWILDGGTGYDYLGLGLEDVATSYTLNYDGLSDDVSLSGGSTFRNIESVWINFGSGNDTINVVNGMGTTGSEGTYFNGLGGVDTFNIDGFTGLNNEVLGGTNGLGGATKNDTLNLSLDNGATAHVSYISDGSNSFNLSISGSGSFTASQIEHLNYAMEDSDNRVVVNSLPTFASNVSLHVDARGGFDSLEMNFAISDQEVQNVVWSIQGQTTLSSNVGYYDNFESIELNLGGGNNLLHMGDETDSIYSMRGSDVVYAGGGNDHLEAKYYFGPALAVSYYGESGDDVLIGGDANDILDGGTGNDTLYGNSGDDTLAGGDGFDLLFGGDGNDALDGGAEDDFLSGGAGNDNLIGGSGNDNLSGGAGADALDGGAGFDMVSYEDSAGPVVVSLLNSGVNTGDAAGDTYVSVEGVWGSLYADTITGNNERNDIFGQAGDDVIINSSNVANGDRYYGQGGSDRFYLNDENVSLNYLIDGGADIDTLYASHLTNITVSNVERLGVLGTYYGSVSTLGTFSQILTGVYYSLGFVFSGSGGTLDIGSRLSGAVSALNVNASGLTSGVTVKLASGNDNFIGSNYDDVITGGRGSDILSGGTGYDTAVYDFNASTAKIVSYAGSVYVYDSAHRELDQLQGIEALQFNDKTVSIASLPAFDALEYLASNPDLAISFGTNTAAAASHYINSGLFEGRNTTSFNALSYLASNPDLMTAYGTNTLSATYHYIQAGVFEHRNTATFDALAYVASNPDLLVAFGSDTTSATLHYINNGYSEHRSTTSFEALEYLASNPDLILGMGVNTAEATLHYVKNGYSEHRSTTSFDALEYLASNPDLIVGLGSNTTEATLHYVKYGYSEHRSTTSFDALEYIASNPDLLLAYGANTEKAEQHYVDAGFYEHRSVSGFDAAQYLANYSDLRTAFGNDLHAAELHYILHGYAEHRSDHVL